MIVAPRVRRHNRGMHYGKLFGWGIVIYAVMYLVVALLALYGIAPSLLARVLSLAALIGLATMAGLSIRRHTTRDILPYSIVWTLEVIALDALMSMPYTGFSIYLDWNVWVGYALVALVPLFTQYLHQRSESARNDL